MRTRLLTRLPLLALLLCAAAVGSASAEPLGDTRTPEVLGSSSRLLNLRQQLADQLRTSAFRMVRVGV